jgi:succinate-semialdehyde dehydrogenase/glutarate-semialdehyde dehydrogenase
MATITTVDPATGADLATYDAHDEAGVEATLAATYAASHVWAATSRAGR